MPQRRPAFLFFPGLVLLSMLASCGKKPTALRVAEQFGLAYAPVTIARELGFVEEALEQAGLDTRVEWLRLANTATIREAAVAGRVDAAFMGIPPYLISKAGGMDWRIAAGLNRSPLALVTGRDHIRSLADIRPEDRIALPQPGSIQHILLAMGAERQLGDPRRFDRQLVTLSHPDATQALLAGREIAAHFSAPPYLALELRQAGVREVIRGDECFGGPFTFIVTVATEELARRRPREYQAFLAGIRRGIAFVRAEPDRSARLLAPIYDLDAQTIRTLLTEAGNEYGEAVLGVERFVEFMTAHAYLPQDFDDGDALFWDPAVREPPQ